MAFIKVSNSGFTFTEVLLVIGILGVIVALAIPFYQSFQVSSELDNTTQEIVQTLRRAQVKAMAAYSFSAFGVHLESQKFVLFQGTSYNPADPLNESVTISNVLSINSAVGPDVIFTSVAGTTTNTGTITVSTSSGDSKIISINDLGVINAI